MLAAEGLEVLVLERRDAPGGAVASEELVPGEGIFLCGAGTSPGGEVSGLPGLNAALAVLNHLS